MDVTRALFICFAFGLSTLYSGTVAALGGSAAVLVGYGMTGQQDDDAPLPSATASG